jgi:hypothetical protein
MVGDDVVLAGCDGPDGPVVFLSVVVVVDDDVVDDFADVLASDFALSFAGLAVVLVVDDGGSGVGGAVLVVDGSTPAAPAFGSTGVPAVAPVLAGDAGAGDDVAPAEGLAGAASDWGDGGGIPASGADVAGRATSSPGATGWDRAAWRARRTSGCDMGETRLVEKRDETSCTPNNPRSTPLAVPRAHVTTRTRRITFMFGAGTT